MEIDAAVPQEQQPYWQTRTSVAPIKAEYVLWDRVTARDRPDRPQAASSASVSAGGASEGHGEAAAAAANDAASLPPPPAMDDDDAAEGRPGGSKAPGMSDLSRSNEDGPPRKKQRGGNGHDNDRSKGGADGSRGGGGSMNKGRTFARVTEDGPKLCNATARGIECDKLASVGIECKMSHDLKAYLESSKNEDILVQKPDEEPQQTTCPVRVFATRAASLPKCVGLANLRDSISTSCANSYSPV